MHNCYKVQRVSDALPSTVKAQLKRKQPISEVLENVPACSSSYKPLSIPLRPSKPQIPANIDTPEAFFELFIMPAHFQTIAHHMNLNVEAKHIKSNKEKKEEKRPWHETTGAEIGVFIGVLLLQGEFWLPKPSDYWRTNANKVIILLKR